MNLNNSGIITPEFRNAAHHIVAGTARLAQDARDVLYKFGVGINDAVDGVFLPTVRGVSEAAYHPALHTKDYYAWVNNMLSGAQSREQVIEILQEIAKILTNGHLEDYIK